MEAVCSNGHTGWGEAYAGVYAPELIAPTIKFLSNLVVGRPLSEFNQILDDISRIPFIGRNGLIRSIASAIDIALLDVAGKILDKPLYALLGGEDFDSPPVYASGGSAICTPDDIPGEIEGYLKSGHTSYKMRVGYQPWATDIERVKIARDTLQSGQDLMIDAIMGTLTPPWSSEIAISRAADLKEYNPCWLEEPVHPEDVNGLARTRASSQVPIAAGEAYSSLHEYQELREAEAVDIIQFDATHSGGIRSCLTIADRFAKEEIPAAVHVWGSAVASAANMHLAFAIPHLYYLEKPMVSLELSDQMWIDKPQVLNGRFAKPEAPGLGIELNLELKNKYELVPGSGYSLNRG